MTDNEKIDVESSGTATDEGGATEVGAPPIHRIKKKPNPEEEA